MLFALSTLVTAQLRTIVSDGNWATSGIWSGGNIATTIAEDVDMNNNVSVTVNNGQSFNVGNLTANNNNILTVNAGGTLTLGDGSNARSLTGGNNTTITVAGDLIIYGNLSVVNNLTISITGSGTITILGNVDMNNNGSLIVNGDMSVNGNFTGGNNTSVNVNGTVSVNGTTTMGANSTLTGSGVFAAHGGCTGPVAFCNSGTLPLRLVSFIAVNQIDKVALKWRTDFEIGVSHFTIQRSKDARDFSDIGTIQSANNSSGHLYNFIDERPLSGKSYYRLVETDLDGKKTYLQIRSVDITPSPQVIFYPNPVTDGQLNLLSNFDTTSGYRIVVTDLSSQVILQLEGKEQDLQFPMLAGPGLYIVQFSSPSYRTVKKIIVK